MGGFISYFFREVCIRFLHISQNMLLGGLAKGHPTEVTDLHQTEDSIPVASSFPNPVKEKSHLSDISHENTPGDTTRTASIFQTTSASDHTEDVDKIDIHVVYAGKPIEITVFPLETISVLHQQACDQVHKKPENMKLIFNGEQLDLEKKVSQYPKLRRGTKVRLIRAS